MNKRQIIGIFFIFLSSGIFFPALRADLPAASRVLLRREISGRDADFLRDTVRQLDRLRRAAGIKLPDRSLLVIPGAKRFHAAPYELHLPGDASLWETDFLLRSRIYTALAAHRFSIDCPAEPPPLSPWAAHGLDNSVRAAASMGQYISGNITYRQLAALCAATGTLPDFVTLCRHDLFSAASISPIAAEQARMLLYIFAANNRIRDFFYGVTTGEKPDFWLKWYTSDTAARKELTAQAKAMLWNRFSPLPPLEALKQMEQLQVFQIPEVLENGKFSGKTLPVDFSGFAGFMTERRDETGQMRETSAASWLKLGNMLTPAERKNCTVIAGLIRDAGINDSIPEQFTAAVNDLTGLLKKRQQAELFLNSALDQFSPPAVRLALPLEAAENHFPAVTTGEKEFFYRTFDTYVK